MTRKNWLIYLIMAISTCTAAKAASEPNECAWMADVFDLVTSTVPVEWQGHLEGNSPEPAFCASVILGTNDWGSIIEQMQNTPDWKTLSKAQHELCRHSQFYQHRGSSSGVYADYQVFYLYAVTAEDARKLARVFLKAKSAQTRQRRSGQRHQIRLSKARLAEAQEDLPLKQAEFAAVKQQYEKIKTNVRYASLSDTEIAENAKETILRMNTLMDEVDIDRVATEARIRAIQHQLKRVDGNTHLQTPLELQLIQQTIELTGFEAQKLSALKTLEQRNGFITLFQRYADLGDQTRDLQDRVDRTPDWLAEQESRFQGPENVLAPPLAGNRVTIHQLQCPNRYILICIKIRCKTDLPTQFILVNQMAD
ncbi:MAG: hypothetical protein HQ515_00095 [Phycisphaeraceae bacterium]|nr:hypothetical protein [Phycisphaeraceae bacterium]